MYTLLSGLYKHITQKDEYFVLILGLDNAGKTTLLEAAKTRLVPNHQGANLQKITTTVRLPRAGAASLFMAYVISYECKVFKAVLVQGLVVVVPL